MAAIAIVAAATLAWPARDSGAVGTAVFPGGSPTPGYNMVVWRESTGQVTSASSVASLLQLQSGGLDQQAVWMLTSGTWLYFLSTAPGAGTLEQVPPTAALVVIFADRELRPNLQARPASDLHVETTPDGRVLLRFTAETWNLGPGPLEVVGKGVTTVAKQTIDQRLYRQDGSYSDRAAGNFVYHPAHEHVHFEDFALYTLRPARPGTQSVRGSKITSCLVDNARIEQTVARAAQKPAYLKCESEIQGLSVGWSDVYRYDLEGQALDVTGLPDGTYELVITIDPDQRLLEADESDNSSEVVIELNAARSTVRVISGGQVVD